MAKEFRVKITKDPDNPGVCHSDPDPFRAKRGDFVIFEFDEPGAQILFNGESPFDPKNRPFAPKKMEVGSGAPERKGYKYRVTWPTDNGAGNGSGEIIP
jgi:hypothetical protein